MAEFIQVQTTTDSRDEAEGLASALVERRLAACVQIVGPVASVYRWQGDVQRSEEWLCLIKTTAGRESELTKALQQLHSYDCPEVIAMPILGGNQNYLNWLSEQVN